MAPAAIPILIGGTALVKGAAGIAAANKNSRLLKRQAQEELSIGVGEADLVREAARAQIGRQISAHSESGFTPGIGSSLTALQESFIAREVDIQTLNQNARGRSDALIAQAKQQKRTALFSAASELIGAAGSIAGYKSGSKAAGQ